MRLLITILLISFLHPAYVPRNYYFAATGNDNTGNGTIGSPYQTLAKLASLPLATGDSVLFRRGDVFPGKWKISTSDIVASAYGTGAQPELTGFVTLSGWTNTGGSIWEAPLSAGNRLNVVTINSRPQHRGRYPNAGGFNGGYLSFESHNGFTSITDNEYAGITNWDANGTAEMGIRPQHYLGNIFPITSQSGTGGRTILYSGGNTADFDNREPIDGFGYFIQNDIRTLDEQGEWFYNTSLQKISLFSLTNPSALTIKAATIDTLLDFSNVSNVKLFNLNITGVNKIGVYVQNGTGNSITNCTVQYIGTNAIYSRFCANINIQDNTIRQVYNNAIDLALGGSPNVQGNNIDSIGLIPGEGFRGNLAHSGIFINGNGGMCWNNIVWHVGYYGIVTTGANTKVNYNFVNYAVAKYGDGGGIYTSGPGINREIIGNIVINILGNSDGTNDPHPLGEGIYPDEASEYITIRDNYIYNVSDHGLYLHDIHSLVVRNNLIVNPGNAGIAAVHDFLQQSVPMRNLVIKGNTIVSSSQLPTVIPNGTGATAAAILIQSTTPSYSELQAFGVCDSNAYYAPFKMTDIIRVSYRPTFGAAVSTAQVDSEGYRKYYSYSLAGWQAAFGQDRSSVTGLKYAAYVATPIGGEMYPSGNFSAGVGNTLNPNTGWSQVSAVTGQLTGQAAALTYTGSTPASHGMEMWFFDNANNQNFIAGHKYRARFTMKAVLDSELTFYAQMRSTAGGGTQDSRQISFPVDGYAKNYELIFQMPVTTTGHYLALTARNGAVNCPAFYVDNVSIQEVDTTQTNPEDFIRFVHNSTGITQTITNAAGFVDARGRPANGPMLPGAKVLFAGPSLTYKGRLNPVTQ